MKKSDGLTRRQLLKTGAAVGAGALVASRLGSGLAVAAKSPVQVPRRVLGKTKQKVPILLVGGAVDLDPVFDPKLAEAFRYGANYFDAAAAYGGGSCEPAVGAYLAKAKNRKKVWITTKAHERDPAGFERRVEKSLKNLRTSYVDLYFMHGVHDAAVISKDMAKLAARLKKQGKIRFFGFSCHHGNVAELLHKAANESWIDAVMFRYNFRQYGNAKLNKAIDAAAKANVGLIAMKTQGSAASFEKAWKPHLGKWNKHQAVLKAVWDDKRITAAVSHMDTLGKLKENVAAAVNKTKLSAAEMEQLQRYAVDTRSAACDGCDHLCGAGVDAPVRIGDTMRYLMYHDTYGERDKARRLFRELPAAAQRLDGVDFRGASARCPHGVDIVAHMKRAAEVLS